MKDKRLFFASLVFALLFAFAAAAIFTPLKRVFSPFVTAFMLVYFLSPPVKAMEKLKIGRTAATAAVYAAIAGVVFFAAFYALPKIYDAGVEIYYMAEALLNKWGIGKISFDLISSGAERVYDASMGAAKGAAQFGVGAAAAFYMIAGAKGLKKGLKEFVPDEMVPSLRLLADDAKSAFDTFFRGQLVVAAILFVMEGTLLFALGVPYAWALGLAGGLLDIIPYVGAFIAAVLMLLVCAVSAPGKLIFVLVGFLIIQQIENNIISPKIAGGNMEIHPAFVVLALYIGSFGGFWGILLALPLTGVVKKICVRLLQSIL